MHMPESATRFTSDEKAGAVLSPRFPGLVPPGLWFWVFTPPSGARNYYSVHVYYVRGPGTTDPDCQQSFKRAYF